MNDAFRHLRREVGKYKSSARVKALLGSYDAQAELGWTRTPYYAHIIQRATHSASLLGIPRISVIELGVAEGRGLLTMEYHAQQAERRWPVKVDIYGFDSAHGLPSGIRDYRDLPFCWKEGDYQMDYPALKNKLTRATLVLGDVKETVPSFSKKYKPAPIGAIAFDLDYYSSTKVAMPLLNPALCLPRVFTYFDDIIGSKLANLYCERTGERLAINEYNNEHSDAMVDEAYYPLPDATWAKQIRIAHFFSHPLYNKYIY